MNKYISRLCLVVLAGTFQPAQSMNFINQNEQRLKKYGPYVIAGLGISYGILATAANNERLLNLFYKYPFESFHKHQKGIARLALGFCLAKIATADASDPEIDNTEQHSIVDLFKKNISEALYVTKTKLESIHPKLLPFLKLGISIYAMNLILKGASSIGKDLGKAGSLDVALVYKATSIINSAALSTIGLASHPLIALRIMLKRNMLGDLVGMCGEKLSDLFDDLTL